MASPATARTLPSVPSSPEDLFAERQQPESLRLLHEELQQLESLGLLEVEYDSEGIRRYRPAGYLVPDDEWGVS